MKLLKSQSDDNTEQEEQKTSYLELNSYLLEAKKTQYAYQFGKKVVVNSL